MNIILGPKGLIRPKENITKDFFESEGTLDVSVNCNNPVDALSSDDIAKRLIHSFEDWYNISTQIECTPDLPEDHAFDGGNEETKYVSHIFRLKQI